MKILRFAATALLMGCTMMPLTKYEKDEVVHPTPTEKSMESIERARLERTADAKLSEQAEEMPLMILSDGDAYWKFNALPLVTDVPKDVVEARRGPDGFTVHFKYGNPHHIVHCAIARVDRSLTELDYLLNYGTILGRQRDCGGDGQATGYVRDADFFVYILIHQDDTAYLAIRNTTEGTKKLLDLPNNIVRAVRSSRSHTKPIIGNGSITYIYPNRATASSEEQMDLRFGDVHLKIDGSTVALVQDESNE